jgi:hypothetical protein
MASANVARKFFTGHVLAGLLVSACVFALCANEAMAQRGGGRGGGASASRGGGGGGGTGRHGGRTAQSSVSGGNRASASSANRGNAAGNRSGNTSNRNSGNTNSGNRTTNIGSNNNINIDRGDVNIDIEGGYNGCCRARYPVAAGVAIGAMAGMTAAAIGSYYYALPASGCTMVTMGGVGYYQCGSAYYQQSMNGDQVVYVSVNP